MEKNVRKVYIFILSVVFVVLFNLYSYANDTVSISGGISNKSFANIVLNDVFVEVQGTKNIKVKTDRGGNYIISGLPKGGTYTLTVSKNGYTFSPETKIFRNLQEGKINQNFIASPVMCSISGKVIEGKKPVKGVVVMISNRAIKYYTNQDGEYMIDNLEYRGSYEVSVVSDEHLFEPFKVEALEKDIVHNFIKDIVIKGKVTSLGYEVPNVELNINGSVYKTGEDGSFLIDGISSNGDYVLSLNGNKYDLVPKSISIKKITSDKYYDFEIFGTFSGKVTLKNKPLKDVVLRLIDNKGDEQVTRTDSNGFYKFMKVGLNQEYRIEVSSKGFSFIPKNREIKSLIAENNVQHFKADVEKYNLNINVFDGEQPIEGAIVILKNGKNIVYNVTDKNGVCILRDLVANSKYIVSIKKENVNFVKSNYIIDRLSNDEKIYCEALLNISGTISYDDSKIGVENVIVSCGDKDIKTDKEGKYILKNLEPKKAYTIKVSSSNLVFNQNERVFYSLKNSYNDCNFLVVVSKKEKAKRAKEAEEAEKARIKAEKEEQARLAKENKKKLEEEAKEKAKREYK